MQRSPIVAGQFYPASPGELDDMVRGYLARAEDEIAESTLLAMVPHAGYVFSGGVAGMTVGSARLADTMLLLGPNHTGTGASMAVWDSGIWKIPGADVPVEESLAEEILSRVSGMSSDFDAHLREHSLEVLVPFLHAANSAMRMVPISISEPRLELLLEAGKGLADVIRAWPEPVSIVVSSDMSHYLPQDKARERDEFALAQILALAPERLYKVVREKGITMCGVLPMVVGMAAARELGAEKARIIGYATSGDISGDYSQVVGYAGVLVD